MKGCQNSLKQIWFLIPHNTILYKYQTKTTKRIRLKDVLRIRQRKEHSFDKTSYVLIVKMYFGGL
jgi:hypothetical protein